MIYRPDIDGLRAISVWLVILFHYQSSLPINGYVGVDIFFVISGYLITKIIQKEINENNFSISAFYIRRIRRILPALFVVLLTTFLMAYVLFLPKDFYSYALSLLSSLGFGANIFFWYESGYFDKSAIYKPLLHIWSLGVEEQFYIIFPLLLLWVNIKYKNHVFYILSGIVLLSFSINILNIEYEKSASAFYLLPSRAWELSIGSILAIIKIPNTNHRFWPELLSWIGGVSLVVGVIYPFEQQNFPGYFALFPTIGAALLIFSGSISNKLSLVRTLSLPPMIFMGKISYSLYLWHWPIYVYASYYMLDYVPVSIRIILLFLCVLLAVISWKYIEMPVRKKKVLPSNKILYISAVASFLILSICALIVMFTNGATYRFDKSINNIDDAPMMKDYNRTKVGNIEIGMLGLEKDINQSDFMVIGDSHAIAIAPALHELALKYNKTGLLVTVSGCFLSKKYLNETPTLNSCIAHVETAKRLIEENKSIKTIFLAARWEEKVNGKWKKRGVNLDEERMWEIQESGVLEFNKYMNSLNKNIVIIGQVPQVYHGASNIPSVLARIKIHGYQEDKRPTLDQYLKQHERVIPMIKRIALQTNAHVIWPHEELCKHGFCEISNDSRSFYKDDNHISIYGAERLSPLFEKYFHN